jgi:L-aspartate oxidase
MEERKMSFSEQKIKSEFLVIGSGIAGLRAAIDLGEKGKKVALVTKSKLEDSNTYYAQGGIAGVDPVRVKNGLDSFESHIDDTMRAGDGLCVPHIVNRFAHRAFPDAVQFLIDKGIAFSVGNTGEYVLHQEGGHEFERVYCLADHTGVAIEEDLAAAARDNPDITIFEDHTAVNLITQNQFSTVKALRDRCLGASVLDRQKGKIRTFEAGTTFLATGGAGRAFLHTSNPENTNGDGIAMAFRAGARIANMEFFQFHPTILYEANPKHPSERRFLLTEALRGEAMGGKLTIMKDSRDDFVLKYDSRGSHGTRDIVARAIDTEMRRNGLPHVWLNVTSEVTGEKKGYIEEYFPKIYEHCLKKGHDMEEEAIPVIPAAHYTCGGVAVNDYGLSDIDRLYAIGEVACTGLMGANRLASNSLSECALYGKLAVEHALSQQVPSQLPNVTITPWKSATVNPEISHEILNRFWDTIRTAMMQYCAIDRNGPRLRVAVDILDGLVKITDNIYRHFSPTHEIIELRNLALVARLIAESALNRKESRGCHYRSDYPNKNDKQYLGPTIIQKDTGFYILTKDPF